jgi:CubicO group peptidase (beta-lactamase class C family)
MRWCVLVIALASAGAAGAEDTPLRQSLQQFVDRGEVAGAIAVVGRAAGTLQTEAVGRHDADSPAPLKPDALFRIASMTKPVTAIGVMILVDEGKLAVDDPLEKHLPEFRGAMLVSGRSKDAITLTRPTRPPTLRDLLTHTSGISSAWPPALADLYARRHRTLGEVALILSQRPLDFEPGSRWQYCNPGIDLLGRVIEVASGRRYEEFLAERVFGPLGMTDTTFYPTAAQLARVTPTYDRKGGRLVAVPNSIIGPPTGAVYPVPAGGLYSTAADLARLYRMMLNRGTLDGRTILSPAAVAAMTSVHTGDLKCGFTEGIGFGFGWAVVREPAGVNASLSPGSYGHGGAFGTQGWLDPARDLFFVLLIQRVGLPNADASDLRRAVQEHAVRLHEKSK